MNPYLSVKLKVISFISMVMVVYLHAYNLPSSSSTGATENLKGLTSFIQLFFSEGLTRVAVPLFFIISGYLFFLNIEEGTLGEFISKFKKRINSLFLPFLFWSIWGLFIFLILQALPQSKPFFNNKLIVNYSIEELLYTIFLDPLPYQLWFVRDLMVLIIISPIIYWIIRYLNFTTLFFFIFLWFTRLDLVLFTNESLLFFSAGSYFGIFKKEYITYKFSKKSWPYTITWLTIILGKTLLIQSDLYNGQALHFLHKISILVGILSIWSAYDILFKDKDFTSSKFYLITSFSFFLYAFHEPALIIVEKILFFITGRSEIKMLLVYLFAPLLTIMFSILIGYNVKKISPRFYKMITGGR